MITGFDAAQFGRHLGALAHAARLHDVSNRAVARLMQWSARDFAALAGTGAEARFELDGGVLVVNGEVARIRREVRSQLRLLDEQLRERNIGGFQLLEAPSVHAVGAIFRALAHFPPHTARETIQQWLDDQGAGTLRALAPRRLGSGVVGGGGDAVRTAATEALQAYLRAVVAVERAIEDGTLVRVPSSLQKAVQWLAELAEEDPRLHLALVTVKQDVAFRARHPVHSAILALALGRRLRLRRAQSMELAIATIIAAGLADDPDDDEILKATAAMVASPRLSASRVRRMLVTVEHRQGVGRTGPPHVPLAGPLHLYSRIAAVVTAYDRMTTSTPDRAPMLPDEALATLRDDPQFDAEIARAFTAVVGRFPLGSAVLLDSGEVGVVYHTPLDPVIAGRPVVRIVRDPRGNPVAHGPLVDLADPVESRRIVRAVEAASMGIDAHRALFAG